MKLIILLASILLSIPLSAQVLDEISNIILNHKTKTCKFEVYKSNSYDRGTHDFRINEKTVEIQGFKSYVNFSNIKNKKISELEISQIQDAIELALQELEAKRVFISDDFSISTYKLENLDFKSTYVEIYIPKNSKNLLEVIKVEDPSMYYQTIPPISDSMRYTSTFIYNHSFEDTPRQGRFILGDRTDPVYGWNDCGAVNFKLESPPDIHSKDSKYWGVKFPPSHGKTCIGLVTRENNSWESISQKLLTNLERNKCYTFQIDVRTDQNFGSPARLSPTGSRSYSNPVLLKIYFSTDMCYTDNFVLQSQPISSDKWQTISFDFKNFDDCNYITIEAYYEDEKEPYKGNIMIDNACLEEITECK